MVRIEDIASQFVEDKMVVSVENDVDNSTVEFALDVEVSDVNRLAYLFAKTASGKLENAEENLQLQQEVMTAILKRSYPDYADKVINNILLQYGNSLLLELQLLSGIRDRKIWNIMKEKRDEEIKKFKENGLTAAPATQE